MRTFHQSGIGLCSGVACLCLCAVCATPVAAQTDPDAPLSEASTCRFVVGQTEIDGVVQQVGGRACLQPDGSWQIVEDGAGALAFGPAPVYYYDPWYWGPPVVFAAGVSVVFVDRFHHFHHMDHVRYGHGSYGMGVHGGTWHGGASTHIWSGMSHGGAGHGGMHR